MDLSKIDLCKIGKCELCVLAKQVRARMIEIGEAAKTDGTWDQELMNRFEACANSLESTMQILHRFESRKYKPTRNLQELTHSGEGSGTEEERWRVIHEKMLREAFQLLSYEAPESSP